jgi:hypothetical protein
MLTISKPPLAVQFPGFLCDPLCPLWLFFFRWWLTLLAPHAPEGAHTEITKGQAKAQGYRQAGRLSVARLIFCELPAQGNSADRRQNQENKARNFEPKLMQNASERAQRNLAGLKDRIHGPIVARVLPSHLCENAQLAG